MNGGLISRAPLDIKAIVLHVLMGHVGKDNRITRERLAHQVASRSGLKRYDPGEYDRACRKAIEELRRTDPMGTLICSSSGQPGYFIAADEDELRETINQDKRRALSLLKRVSEQERRGLRALERLPLVQGEMW